MSIWQGVKDRYESLQVRERVLISGATLAVVYLIWNMVAELPLQQQRTALAEREYAAQQAIKVAMAEVNVLQRIRGAGPEDYEQKVAALKQKLLSLDEEIRTVNSGIVSAHEIPAILRDILAQLDVVELEQLQTLPVSTLVLADDASLQTGQRREPAQREATAAAGGIVYRHSFELLLRGTEQSLLDFFTRIEVLNAPVYWHSLHQATHKPPNASASITLYFLTADDLSAGL